jgi:hypothetical protein
VRIRGAVVDALIETWTGDTWTVITASAVQSF